MTNREKALAVIERLGQEIYGKDEVIREVMTALVAGGHVLLEDIPGVGKTTLASGLARAMDLPYRRVQFTSDLMPLDLTGFSVYDRNAEKFVYHTGSLFCSLLLADEINRASPKTQSALLEAMEEGKVTAEGVTRPLPAPFVVIATQNPLGSAGTQLLPESQVDRFMVSLSMGYPDEASEIRMARDRSRGLRTAGQPDSAGSVIDGQEFLEMQKEAAETFVHDRVYTYIMDLIKATREAPGVLRGASPRATIALTRCAKAAAWLKGRDYVLPEDVAEQFPYVTGHRLVLERQARAEGGTAKAVVDRILSEVPAPGLGASR